MDAIYTMMLMRFSALPGPEILSVGTTHESRESGVKQLARDPDDSTTRVGCRGYRVLPFGPWDWCMARYLALLPGSQALAVRAEREWFRQRYKRV